jgi:hypothetical protein
VRIEPGPRIDVAAFECRTPIGMLHVEDLDVALFELRIAQRAEQEKVWVRTFGRGDLLAAQFGYALVGRVLGDDQRRPLGLRVEEDGANRRAVRAREQRRASGGRTELDRICRKKAVGFIGA